MAGRSQPEEVPWRRRRGSAGGAIRGEGRGANDKITVGMIGIGIRGSLLLERFYARAKDTATVVAICDAYTGNLAKAGARIAAVGGNTPQTYADYRDLLRDKSIDAVFIATPEHLHAAMLIDALQAGKHVYCEKPLAHTIEEGEQILHAAENPNRLSRWARRTAATRSTSRPRKWWPRA